MRVGFGQFVVGLVLVLTVSVPAVPADEAEYRPLVVPPAPPNPQNPALPPVPPCVVDGFVIDCTAGGNWLTGEADKPVAFVNALSPWAADRVADIQKIAVGDFIFVGAGNSTTIHVHDDVSIAAVHDNVVFVVEGGPAGAQWTCRHICANLPDTSVSVSINPLKVPPEDWARPTLGFPPTSGTITVTFNP